MPKELLCKVVDGLLAFVGVSHSEKLVRCQLDVFEKFCKVLGIATCALS